MHIDKVHRISLLSMRAVLACFAVTTAWGQARSSDGEIRAYLGLIPRHATISVANLAIEKEWFITKLGFDELSMPQPGGPGGKIKGAELEIPGYQIHLIQFEGSRRTKMPGPTFLSQGWVHIAFSVTDIVKASAFLKSSAVEVQEIRGRNGTVETLVLHDPEGNEIELFSR